MPHHKPRGYPSALTTRTQRLRESRHGKPHVKRAYAQERRVVLDPQSGEVVVQHVSRPMGYKPVPPEGYERKVPLIETVHHGEKSPRGQGASKPKKEQS